MGTNDLVRQRQNAGSNVWWTSIPSSESRPIRHSCSCSWFIVTGLTPKRVRVVCYRPVHIFVISFDQCITALTYLTYHEVHG